MSLTSWRGTLQECPLKDRGSEVSNSAILHFSQEVKLP